MSRVSFDHVLLGRALKIPTTAPTPVISIAPIVLPYPSRLVDLQVRISFPSTITSPLPIILLSHGHGHSNNLSSLNGYAPLVNFWASHGFIVIQPTHLSSTTLGFPPSTPGAPLFWKERVEDMKFILDNFPELEELVPLIKGRLDQQKIAVVGHSLGAHTAGLLLGQSLIDDSPSSTGKLTTFVDPRIKAGILLAPAGPGKDLHPAASKILPIFTTSDFSTMTTPTLIVTGSIDISTHFTERGADWHEDVYYESPGEKSLLDLKARGIF